jgi:type VI secretion system protein ImpK
VVAESQTTKLRTFLAPEIAAKQVEVIEKGNSIIVRIAGGGMFPSGSDQLKPEFRDLIDRIALALDSEPGPVLIVGHSDSDRIRSPRFKDNAALSLARAKSVMAAMARKIADPKRLSSEGRADREPLVPNDSATNKAINRRIEVSISRTS